MDPPISRVQFPVMWTVRGAKWIALTGYFLAAAGIVLYTQLGRIAEWNIGHNVLDSAAAISTAATFGGFLAAIIGSATWARRTATQQPLKIAISIGVASLFLILLTDVNVHGPSAILMFLLPFSVVNVLSLLVVTRW
jgi:fucose 4-O-acetylase-like acetyltransferase